jgi:CheY-like chemotaxis protein
MRKMLIVDDEAILRILVEATLDSPEWEVLPVSTGKAALEAAVSKPPDLVVLDWNMPGMSGIDALRALRQNPRTASLPVIMLTGMGEKHRASALAAGANAYLVKPFSPLDLLKTIKRVLTADGHDIRLKGK